MTTSTNRIEGVLLGLAVGDALGPGYEFGPSVTGPVGMIGGGPFGWEPGEWTDDTQMAICIIENASPGVIDLEATGDRFIDWAGECSDIGIQTRAVLSRARSGVEMPDIARAHHQRKPDRSAGNGSLMRTGVVPLPFLGDREAIAETARSVSALTHFDRQCQEACVLWSLAIDRALSTGEVPDLRENLDLLPADRALKWASIIDEAESRPPGVFTPNGYVVTALQAAWSSIIHTAGSGDHFGNAVIQAVRIGHDTDTVAAIAGTLLGAVHGASAIPEDWVSQIHGWPGLTAADLIELTHKATGPGA